MTQNREIILNEAELNDVQLWRASNPGMSLIKYADLNLSGDELIAVTRIFWPEFIEHGGGIFWKESFVEKNYLSWKTRFPFNIANIERAMNHFNVAKLKGMQSLSWQNVAYFGQTVIYCWQQSLKVRFPQHQFIVTQIENEEERDYVISFWKAE